MTDTDEHKALTAERDKLKGMVKKARAKAMEDELWLETFLKDTEGV